MLGASLGGVKPRDAGRNRLSRQGINRARVRDPARNMAVARPNGAAEVILGGRAMTYHGIWFPFSIHFASKPQRLIRIARPPRRG